MYLLDRLVLFLVAITFAIVPFLPIRKWLKKHSRIHGLLIVLVAESIVLFGPTVLFQASIPGRVDADFNDYEHVEMFVYQGKIYSIAAYDYVSEEGEEVTFTSSKLAVYTPWIIGYYESEDAMNEITYLYDDLQGERELIFFHWHPLDDGSTLVVVGNNLQNPLTSLVIEGRTIDFTVLNDPDFVYFVVPTGESIRFFGDSILYNGIEIGHLIDD